MERIRLDIIPKGLMPVCHASQYDAGRVIRLDLMDGLQGYSLTNEEIELNVRKPDGHIVTASVDVVEGQTYVDIVTTEQMCAVEGENICELKISKDNAEIYSLNFKMMVEKSVTEGGDPSESFIYNLRTQIAEGVAEEVAEQYDSANVIFDNEPTDNHGIGYAVTSEGIKTAIDNAFDYDNTASGSIVHITDGADNIPVKSIVSQIVAIESGSGTKSPSNPYTISGFDSGIVTRCGKNLFNFSPTTVTSSRTIASNIFLKAGNYVCSFLVNNTTAISGYFQVRIGTTSIGGVNFGENYQGIVSKAFTLSEDSTVNIFVGGASAGYNFEFSNGQIELGNSSPTTYEAYNGNTYTFTFGQTVYGGHFDNKGNLVVTHKDFTYDGNENWVNVGGQYPFAFYLDTLLTDMKTDNISGNLSNIFPWTIEPVPTSNAMRWQNPTNTGRLYVYDYDHSGDLASFKAMLNTTPLKATYLLATPITLAISSQDIPTLLGENNIFSNCGDVEVTYYTSKSNDILEFIDSEIGKKNGTNIPIEANSQDSIKDYVDNGLNGKVDTSYLNDMLVVERKFRDVTFDSYYQSIEIDVTKSGYTPTGVVGFQTNTVGALFFRCNLTGNTLYIGLVARDGTTPITGTIATYADVLYVKNS